MLLLNRHRETNFLCGNLKCTHNIITDRLGAYCEKIWKDGLVKTNKSLVYRKNKAKFKMESI